MSDKRPIRPFMVIFSGQAFSLFGSRLVQFALVWYITATTGTASTLAFASIVAMVPQVFVGPFAGALVDRWNRKLVMMVSDSLIALVVVVLAFLFSTGNVQLWHIYVAMFIRSLGGAFQWPAMQATTTLMVDREQLSRIAGMNQSLQGLVAIVAPPLGALLLEILPIQSILLVDVATAVVAVGPLFFIKVPQPIRELTEMKGLKTILDDMKEGFRFVWKWKGLRFILAMSMLINFLMNPAFSLLPLVVTNHFNGGAVELGWLQSANGVGMIAGGLLLGIWGGFKKRIVTAMSSIIVGGIFLEAFAFMPPELFNVAIGCVFMFAVFNSMANATFFSSMQSVIPPEMQGRVFTILMSFSGGMTPIGLAFAGPVSDALGIFIWFRLGGVVISLMGVVAFFIPAVMKFEEEAGITTVPLEE
ncbi:MAG: MFS transporter [Candidatus Bathyarchaeota archaeon]|nr:MFS transporter [Candidatus Bathyarchaeota archaeon]